MIPRIANPKVSLKLFMFVCVDVCGVTLFLRNFSIDFSENLNKDAATQVHKTDEALFFNFDLQIGLSIKGLCDTPGRGLIRSITVYTGWSDTLATPSTEKLAHNEKKVSL